MTTIDGSGRELRLLAARYEAAATSEKGPLLDQVCAATGWSRDHARRRLRHAVAFTDLRVDAASSGRRTYSEDVIVVLERVWDWSGGMSGRYLAAALPDLLGALEAHGELVVGAARYNRDVGEELCAMSPATIDRCLALAREAAKVRSATHHREWSLLRSRPIATAEPTGPIDEPGLVLADAVRCWHSSTGGPVHTVSLLDGFTGWISVRSVAGEGAQHLRLGFDKAASAVPFAITSIDPDRSCARAGIDSGWTPERLLGSRARPPTGGGRRGGRTSRLAGRFGYAAEDAIVDGYWLDKLWRAVCDRLNLFTPLVRAGDEGNDGPQTPYQRLLDAGVLSRHKVRDLVRSRRRANPAQLARDIAVARQRLVVVRASCAWRSRRAANVVYGGRRRASEGIGLPGPCPDAMQPWLLGPLSPHAGSTDRWALATQNTANFPTFPIPMAFLRCMRSDSGQSSFITLPRREVMSHIVVTRESSYSSSTL